MNLFRSLTILSVFMAFACTISCKEKSVELNHENIHEVQKRESKPGAAIDLISSSIVSINPNELTQIKLLFDVKEPSGILSLEFFAGEGLDLLDTKMVQQINLPVSSPIELPIKMRAIVDGRYYLNIHANIANGDSPSMRNLAVIVQVGAEVKAEKSIQLKQTSGEKVISLPAQETISNQ